MLSSPWLRFWKWYLPCGLLLSALVAAGWQWRVAGILHDLDLAEDQILASEARIADQALRAVAVDLLTLRDQNELRAYLETGDDAWLEGMGREYLSLLTHSKRYDQIRFLDNAGMELVRADLAGGQPTLAPAWRLQDKSGRGYFRTAFALEDGELYLSRLDLNLEHGEIELPFKPMIRLATPVVDASGTKHGILILNYLAQRLLSQLRALDAKGLANTLLVDCDGYFLLAPNAETTWGFMLPDREHMRMSVLYPDIWRAMLSAPSGRVAGPAGRFAWKTFEPLQSGNTIVSDACSHVDAHGLDHLKWRLVSHLTPDAQRTATNRIDRLALETELLVLALLAFAVRAATVLATERHDHITMLKSMARTDSLTGLANRAAFEERVNLELERARRHGRRFALAALDLDGFKGINDTQGHLAGDRVLQFVAGVLEHNLRCQSDDLACRLGGDEFSVLLCEVPDADTARTVMEKIRTLVAESPWAAQGISVSTGVALYPDHGTSLLELLHLADEAMYLSKELGKNRVTLARVTEAKAP